MSSPLPTIEDVAASPAGDRFRQAEKALAIPAAHITSWLAANAKHSRAAGLFLPSAGIVTLGAGRRVWLLLPQRHVVKSEQVNEAVVITHPSMNGMDPHHFYKGLLICAVTGKPVFMIPASVRRGAWRLPKRRPGDYLLQVGDHLLDFIKESTSLQKDINFSRKLRLHLQGWSQGATLSLAMAAAMRVRNDFELGSLIVGGLPNVKERGRRELFGDVSSIKFMDYVRAGRLSGATYARLHCPSDKSSFLQMLRMNVKFIGDVCATWRDNLPLHETFRHATLRWQLNCLQSQASKNTIIVAAVNDPVSPVDCVRQQTKSANRPPHLVEVDGTHTFGDVIAWPFYAADQVGITI